MDLPDVRRQRWLGDGDVLDATDQVIATVKVGTHPVDVQMGSGRQAAAIWVVNAGSDSVTKINTVSNAVTATIKVGTNPSGIAFDTKNAYVTNAGSGTVSVINLLSNKVTTITGVGGSPTGITVSGGKAYVTNLDGSVAVIDTATGSVTGHIALPAPANSAALSSDGTRLLVAGTDGTVSAIDSRDQHGMQTLQTDPTADRGARHHPRRRHLLPQRQQRQRDPGDRVSAPGHRRSNNPPQVGVPVVSAPDPATGLVTGSLTATDPEGKTLSYSVSDKPDRGNVAFDILTGTFTYTPTDAQRLSAGWTAGRETETFHIAVSDGQHRRRPGDGGHRAERADQRRHRRRRAPTRPGWR